MDKTIIWIYKHTANTFNTFKRLYKETNTVDDEMNMMIAITILPIIKVVTENLHIQRAI